MTELADTLTRDHDLPFRVAHAICARLVAANDREPGRPLSSLVAEISEDLCGTPIGYTDEALATILSARHFVNVRQTSGGPAPSQIARAWQVSTERLDEDRAWGSGASALLRSAERRLAERSALL